MASLVFVNECGNRWASTFINTANGNNIRCFAIRKYAFSIKISVISELN